ncbi:MAG TPA: MerR family transcriptional regulator [Terriglobia bacterium]|nr:MerR family transcriptional regulator [Terriglobia bacterium]
MTNSSLTIGRLARQFRLSRSTLLYYDSIGLLRPAGRSSANYRVYTPSDCRRLEQVCFYRQMGLSLKEIVKALQTPENKITALLEKRLGELDAAIRSLREQQHVILQVLKDKAIGRRIPVMNKARWMSLLRAAGLDEEGMQRWHREFERRFPQSHQEFLEGLGIPEKEIQDIRRWCAKG